MLQGGRCLYQASGGGGGFGSPLERDIARVEDDVRQGYISKELAEKHYGIVFTPGTLLADRPAIEARRKEMRAKGLPVDDPVPPEQTAKPHEHHHHHGDHAPITDEERLVIALSGRCCS